MGEYTYSERGGVPMTYYIRVVREGGVLMTYTRIVGEGCTNDIYSCNERGGVLMTCSHLFLIHTLLSAILHEVLVILKRLFRITLDEMFPRCRLHSEFRYVSKWLIVSLRITRNCVVGNLRVPITIHIVPREILSVTI